MDERLIEVSFPLKQVSLDSVHEKSVRHGHISTLHIWPARRPLAACRAALIATLLPDPGNEEERRELRYKLAGRLVDRTKKKKLSSGRTEEQKSEETEGGILHWGRESSDDLRWFREQIRAAYGGRAPRVLDPFAGGGAIPLEAMRLGCDVTAVDINPVAWFLLKCTLEYPQRLAHQQRPLPDFARSSPEFMEAYFKAQGFKGAALHVQLAALGLDTSEPGTPGASQEQFPSIRVEVSAVETDLAWHIRAWGWWVLQQAKADLERFYPVVDGKTTVAYLWARTVTCKNCRATVPLLKTRWLCKKDNKRVILTMTPNAERSAVVFGVQHEVPTKKGKPAERRAHDKELGSGTMSGSGVTCPCCPIIMTMQDIRLQGLSGKLGAVMTAVVVDGEHGKEYRLPTEEEIVMATAAEQVLPKLYAEIPFGLPEEPLPAKEALGFRVPLYGFDKWYKLFTPRQLLALGTFVKYTRTVRDVMHTQGYTEEWIEAVVSYLAIGIDKLTDYIASLCTWHLTGEKMSHVFVRFALPINWDYAELNPLSSSSGNYLSCIDWVTKVIEHNMLASQAAVEPHVIQQSAIDKSPNQVDVIVTDPPYYDAIPYSDLMDFFYVWLRRTLYGLSPEIDVAFKQPLSPKWDHERNDGELIDDSSRFGGNKQQSKENYETGMFRAFQACYHSLAPDGRLVIVFAHKQPDAWETLVSAIIKAGFVVDGSWPIQTEMGNRTRAISSAALSSSIWLVCKKRAETARPGWDNRVLEEMQQKITLRLRDFWDAGISGPDFVWAATGPALEAYSKHPVVKKADAPGQVMRVSEFLGHVRRFVVDFVVGRILSRHGGSDAVNSLDNVTTYYLLHRTNFAMESAPIGPCILYAVSCGLSDAALINKYDLLTRTGGQARDEDGEDEIDDTEGTGENLYPSEDLYPSQDLFPGGITGTGATATEGTSSTVRLKQWHQRKNAGLDPQGLLIPATMPPVPLIDRVHRLMHLWKAGEEISVDQYLDMHALGHNPLFNQLLQALLELATNDERVLLENISNHIAGRGTLPAYRLVMPDDMEE